MVKIEFKIEIVIDFEIKINSAIHIEIEMDKLVFGIEIGV